MWYSFISSSYFNHCTLRWCYIKNILEIILFVKKERRNLAAYTNSTHMKWENYMDKPDRDKRRLEYIWFRKCLSWKEAAQGADGWMGVGAQKFLLLRSECPPLAAARGSTLAKSILCSSSIGPFPPMLLYSWPGQSAKKPPCTSLTLSAAFTVETR